MCCGMGDAMATGETGRFMAMKGAGYYSKATTGAKHAIDGAAHLVLDAVGRMNLRDDDPPGVNGCSCPR